LQLQQKQCKISSEVAERTSEKATLLTAQQMLVEDEARSQETQQRMERQIQNQDERLREKLEKRRAKLMGCRSFSSYVMGSGSKDTLFTDSSNTEQRLEDFEDRKPMCADFHNVIRENEENEGSGNGSQSGNPPNLDSCSGQNNPQ
jgi:peroxiredoxin family protein